MSNDSEAITAPTPGGRSDAEPTLVAERGTSSVGALSGLQTLTTEVDGRYHLLREFGRGGQSVVLLALDRHIGREVAFKQLLPERRAETASSSVGERFLREARITGQLEHPGIVPVHEVGRRSDGSLYYTQKLVRGRTLRGAMAACTTQVERLRLLPNLLAVCQAVAYAHGRGVVHRDLKPENVMVGEFGETVVLDWGLARTGGDDASAAEQKNAVDSLIGEGAERTQQGSRLGTPAYMSPEQAVGDIAAVDRRSDVWSLGVMLYELLTGQRPFAGETAVAVMREVASGVLRPVRTLNRRAPPELAAIAERALQREPARRYPDAAALAAEFSSYAAGGLVSAYAYSAWELLRRAAVRNRWQLTALALASVLVGAWLWTSVIPGVLRGRRSVDLSNELVKVDRRIRDLDRQLAAPPLEQADLVRLEARLMAEATEAQRLRTLLEGSGRALDQPPLEQALHAVLAELYSDTWAIPPAFLERVEANLSALRRSPSTKAAWQRTRAAWPVIHAEIAAAQLPEVVGYLAWVETLTDPQAVSGAGARGAWQLMPMSARKYGVRVDDDWKEDGVDERTDLQLSTRAASKYLGKLLFQFGSDAFLLSIAAYNEGEGKVDRILQRLATEPGGYRREKRDYWRMIRLRVLPSEVVEYAAQFLAIAVAARDPSQYGLE